MLYGKKKLMSVVLACLVAMPSVADVRVLLAYDTSGLTPLRIFRSDNHTAMQASSETGASAGRVNPLDMKLTWRDASGSTLRVSYEPDPRVAHAPGHVGGTGFQSTVQRELAWLVDGPDRARSVLVTLPERLSPVLAGESWTIWLDNLE